MRSKLRKFGVALFVPVLAFMALATTADQAGAYCSFNNDTATLYGYKIGYEATQTASTCDNNNTYHGKISDHSVADGASVEVQFSQNFGGWFTQYYTGQTTFQNYTYYSTANTNGIRLRSANSGTTGSATIQNF